MDGNEPTAPANTGAQSRDMDNMIELAIQERSEHEQRDIAIFCTQERPCPNCGETHINIFQFYLHHN